MLSVQITTYEGTHYIEFTTPQPALSMWHMAIDLHYTHYSALLPAPMEQKPDFFSMTTPMSLLLGNTQHTLTLSLLDNSSDITRKICADYRLDSQHALAIENALLKEQLQLVSPLVRGYRSSLAHNHSVSVECELLRMRAEAAEDHAQNLDRTIGEMEMVLPLLTQSSLPSNLTTTRPHVDGDESSSHPHANLPTQINTEFTPLAEETKEGRGRRKGRGGGASTPRTPRSPSPSYLAPTAASSSYADMWKGKYEELKGKLEKLEEEKRKAPLSTSVGTHSLLPPGKFENNLRHYYPQHILCASKYCIQAE